MLLRQRGQASVQRPSALRASAHDKATETKQSGSTPAQVRCIWRSCPLGIQLTCGCL
jgi:hypothetical protein